MSNINSLSQNISELVDNVNDALSLINGYTESSTTTDDSIVVKLSDGNEITMPSYQNLSKRVERAENTVAAFVKGAGVVETDDGTYRKIKAQAVPKAPKTIESVGVVTTFDTETNWFFESMMFPKCVIKIDLKNQIEDESDRVYVNRIIIDNTADNRGYYTDRISGKGLTYQALTSMLKTNGISYSEDTEIVDLPLSYEKFNGSFLIEKIVTKYPTSVNETPKVWYYLDTMNYDLVDDNGTTISNAYILEKGNRLRYNDSLFKIVDVNTSEKCICIEYAVGFESPAVGYTFEIYNEPFKNKIAKIGIGYDEINIVYIKGINENYNILSKDWSQPITFISNDLILENDNITLNDFYHRYCYDFGSEMVAKAKQNTIYAYNGIKPNTPVLSAENMKVVQINTQLEATLESEKYNSLVSSIYTAKSTVEDLRKTIAANKDALIKSTSSEDRTDIQSKINSDSDKLSSETTKYNSLVEELNTMLNNNGAIGYTPKYHIRGFFQIPDPQYSDATTMTGKQEVIGFDIMYRYIHTDNTGVTLNTFEFQNDKKQNVNAVFSDWNMVQSKIKEQEYDETKGMYVWKDEPVTDGNVINVNQIDIPIRNGEKVQIKVRSISEAGYPSNPLKSDWSNTITISFPENLTENDAVTNVIDKTKDDMTAVVLQQTLSSAGLYTHISDSTSDYKHDCSKISFYDTENHLYVSVETIIKNIVDRLNILEKS